MSVLERSSNEYPKIQGYGAIGDCRAAALISCEGSLDWLCWPRFDSRAVFSAILDAENGGRWRIGPTAEFVSSRRYRDNSNVLETTFETSDGAGVLTDAVPVATEETKRRSLLPSHELLRHFRCTRGEIEISIAFEPRLNYGKSSPTLDAVGKLGIRIGAGKGEYWLRASCALDVRKTGAYAVLRLTKGDELSFSLSYAEEAPVVLSPLGVWTKQRIDMTDSWWKQWAKGAKYEGDYRGTVLRSALALKLLTYAPSGAVVAAATTSLPERVGGPLNWDYRYCWLRDASLTIRALLGLGYYDEADAFMNWLLHATALTRPRLRILYTVFGQDSPQETELQHLSGYRNSKPVRIGNAARHQLQLDVYGEVIDAAAQYAYHGGRFERGTQKVLIQLGNYVMKNWNRPDEGIWEPRSGRQNHTHSRLLCWTALDRLLKMQDRGAIDGIPVEDMKRERKRILHDIKHHAWNKKKNSYVSTLGGESLDASQLLLSYYGFEDARSERMQATYAALRNQLGAGDLIYRYDAARSEGAFGICSFWEVEFLALGGGPLEEARSLFERVTAYCNDLGLFSEEIDPNTGDALGNFPQAFTHVGLISAALSIQEREQGKKQLPHREHSAEQNHAPEVLA